MLLTVLWVGDKTANTAGFLFTPSSYRDLAEVCGTLTVPSANEEILFVEAAHVVQVVTSLLRKK